MFAYVYSVILIIFPLVQSEVFVIKGSSVFAERSAKFKLSQKDDLIFKLILLVAL